MAYSYCVSVAMRTLQSVHPSAPTTWPLLFFCCDADTAVRPSVPTTWPLLCFCGDADAAVSPPVRPPPLLGLCCVSVMMRTFAVRPPPLLGPCCVSVAMRTLQSACPSAPTTWPLLQCGHCSPSALTTWPLLLFLHHSCYISHFALCHAAVSII
jgi:hypothetical protein